MNFLFNIFSVNMPRYKYRAKKNKRLMSAMKEAMIDKKIDRNIPLVKRRYSINDSKKLHRYISELKSKTIDPATAMN